jgi:hypothetical protein
VKKITWLGVIFGALVIGYLVFSSFQAQPYRCRVCITYNGRQDCRTAAAQTREGAQRAATTTACVQIASGVIETSQCENTLPDSVDWSQ